MKAVGTCPHCDNKITITFDKFTVKKKAPGDSFNPQDWGLKRRQVIALYYGEGMKQSKIAEKLNCSAPFVSQVILNIKRSMEAEK